MNKTVGWILCGLLVVSGTALATPGGIHEGRASEVLGRIQVGRPLQYQSLTIFPLTLKGSDGRPYVTMDRAVDKGWVEFSELDRAEVKSLSERDALRLRCCPVGGPFRFEETGGPSIAAATCGPLIGPTPTSVDSILFGGPPPARGWRETEESDAGATGT